ncbi:unnamed product [Ostreococcus tauri]|uniref:Unnamed product n=1 Tax=Ostreococcus tauri TaxID=70448 RepID=A0A096P8I8_OSTTA|nr:unnamed product [Ostreococcus tauri]CEG00274.1 unnamed product [Ostreococcus tauri]|eukprot:XP_003083491.2 unnamed product [Ostreococcus tauri]
MERVDGSSRASTSGFPASATSAVIVSAALIIAGVVTGDGTLGRGGLASGAATTAAGEAWRERIIDDIPFEDDHVRLSVPRIEREIAAEENAGEVSWGAAARRGWFAPEPSGTPVAALGKHRKHRYDDDDDEYRSANGLGFELPAFDDDAEDVKKRHARETKEMLSAHERSGEALRRLADESNIFAKDAKLGKKSVEKDLFDQLSKKSSSLIQNSETSHKVEKELKKELKKSVPSGNETTLATDDDDAALAEIEKRTGGSSFVPSETTTLTSTLPIASTNASSDAAQWKATSVVSNATSLMGNHILAEGISTDAIDATKSTPPPVMNVEQKTSIEDVTPKKTIDTTKDLDLYSNAVHGDQEQTETSWARKGLRPADENVLTAENIKRNENTDDEALTLDFLNRFPVRLPQSERETQNWKSYKSSHKAIEEERQEEEKENGETVQRVAAAAVEIVRQEREVEKQRHEKWKSIFSSIYFVGPIGLLMFVSIFYAFVVLVAKKSAKSSKSSPDNDDDNETFKNFVDDAVAPQPSKRNSAKRGRSQSAGFTSTVFGFMQPKVVDVDTDATLSASVSASDLSMSMPAHVRREVSSPERVREPHSSGHMTPIETTLDPTPTGSPARLNRPAHYLNVQLMHKLASLDERRVLSTSSVELEDSREQSPRAPTTPPRPVEKTEAKPPAPAVQMAPPPRLQRPSFPSRAENASIAPRRSGDGPQIVRSTTTKFYK